MLRNNEIGTINTSWLASFSLPDW